VSATSAVIGPYVTGEKPPTLSYTFLDSSGAAIDLTGYTAKFNIKERWGAATQYSATVATPASGIVTYAWTGAEFLTPGHYEAEFWVGNTTLRYDSIRLKFDVQQAVGPVPAI
jgi:hypothetical protein